MADLADLAQQSTEAYLKAARRNSQRFKPLGESAEFCDECGEAIPEARRAAVPGCRLCVTCQEESDAG